MSTLDEIFKTNKLGETKVRQAGWGTDEWVLLKYKIKHKYIGHNEGFNSIGFATDFNAGWQVYNPPKPKVSRAQYAYRLSSDGTTIVSARIFKDDEGFLEWYGGDRPKWFKRLTEIECES